MSEINRLNVSGIGDSHVHPDYSIDAEGSLDQYCRRAFDIGLSEICFVTHYDSDPTRSEREGLMVINGEKQKLSIDALDHYFQDINRAFEEYGRVGLLVKGGLEFGWYPEGVDKFAEIISRFPMEMRLGAVHSIDDYCVCCKSDAEKLFSKLSLTQLADRYFEQLEKCAASRLFNCLAHLDIYRRFGLERYGEEILTIHRGRIEKLFDTMLRNDVGYELNTSAIRHGHDQYYPSMEIVNMARAAGVRLVTLGSDAHRPADLAIDFEAAAATAYELFPYVDE